MRRERFAPSPTGLLHLGHAYSALCGWSAARADHGEFLLRIEDIDTQRSRSEFEATIFEDLAWLGLHWDGEVLKQSDRAEAYRQAIDYLAVRGLCYPCRCTRRDIRNALSAPQQGASGVTYPSATIYPGTCRDRSMQERTGSDAIRLNMRFALDSLGGPDAVGRLRFREIGDEYRGNHTLDHVHLIHEIGDIVLARGDIGTSYHLSVVVDDAFMSVTHVTRGSDLFEFTCLHRLLIELLGLDVPVWNHHRLIRDDGGRRLAKRDDARSIRHYRDAGWNPEDVLALYGLPRI